MSKIKDYLEMFEPKLPNINLYAVTPAEYFYNHKEGDMYYILVHREYEKNSEKALTAMFGPFEAKKVDTELDIIHNTYSETYYSIDVYTEDEVEEYL